MQKNIKNYLIIYLVILAVVVILAAVRVLKQSQKLEFPHGATGPAQTQPQYTLSYDEEFFHFPVIAESNQLNRIAEKDGGGMAYGGSWEVQGTVSAVMKWYIAALTDIGWTIELAPSDPYAEDFQVVTGIKGDRQMTLTLLRKDDGKVEIMLDLPFTSSAEKENE